MPDERSFPDVEFVETDTETIVEELVEVFKAEFGRTPYPADPVYQMILWFASVLAHERSLMNIAAKRNLPRYAEGEFLDSLAEIFYGVTRQEATPAWCTARFTLAEADTRDFIIPAGTEITADGELLFFTTEALTIPAGSTTGDVTVECRESGAEGNGFAVGTLTTMVDQIAGVATVTNTTVTVGGADIETDDAFYYRMRESYEGFSTAGTAGAYKYHALQHNAAVADVAVAEGDPGETLIAILMETGLPTEEEIADMQEYLSSDEIRPVTDLVTVQSPGTVSFAVNVTYYGAARPEPGGEELRTLAEAAVAEYIEWQTSALGRRINPGKLVTLLMVAGAGRVEVTSPVSAAVGEMQCAVLSGTPTITYGGTEV